MELKAALFERYSFLRAGSLPGAADQLGWPFNQLGWIAITLRAPAGSRRLSQGGGEGGREGGGEGQGSMPSVSVTQDVLFCSELQHFKSLDILGTSHSQLQFLPQSLTYLSANPTSRSRVIIVEPTITFSQKHGEGNREKGLHCSACTLCQVGQVFPQIRKTGIGR